MMVTIEMLNYILLFSGEEIRKALRIHYALNPEKLKLLTGGMSKSVVMMYALQAVIEDKMDFEEFKRMLKLK